MPRRRSTSATGLAPRARALRAELSGEPDPVVEARRRKESRCDRWRRRRRGERPHHRGVPAYMMRWLDRLLGAIARRCPRRITRPTSIASPRSRTCTRRSAQPRSALRRCGTSASISRQTRTSAPTSRTARRKPRDRASSLRPADRRASDHTTTGRPPGLPGASCTKPAMRSTSPAAILPSLTPFASSHATTR